MSRAFPFSGQILWIISSIILSLSSSCQASNGRQVQTILNWCSQKHCQDCASSEVLICSNGALSNRCGDLCGCCHSCVQLRDLGASCGSQLALRSSSANFEDSRPRVTVLATTSCKHGLFCINFNCERSDDEVDRVTDKSVEGDVANFGILENDTSGLDESDDLRTNLITEEKMDKFYYPYRAYDNVDAKDVFTTREIDVRKSTSMPRPIRLTTETVSSIGTDKNEFPNTWKDERSSGIESGSYDSQDEVEYPNCDSSGHLVNVIIAGREFQLIYGSEALTDLKLLLKSIDRSQSSSILDEFEALLLYERFKDVIELVNSNGESSSPKEVTDSSSTTEESKNHRENENRIFIETVRDSGALAVLRKFIVPQNSKLPRPRVPIRQYRRKRELEDAEEEDRRSEYSEVVVYDFLNKTPRSMEDSARHWLITREVGIGSEEKLLTSQHSDREDIESTINIRITGIPRITKSAENFDLVEDEEARDRKTVAAGQDYENYDDELEIFVTDANTDVPEFSQADETANFTTSPMSQGYKISQNTISDSEINQADNITEKYWETSTSVEKNSRYSDNKYEFTFPENPVNLEIDDYHELNLRVNETVDEFKAQLNRIETKVVVIQSSLYDMITKFETNEKSKNVENKKIIKDSTTSDYFPYPSSNFTGKRRTASNIRRSPRISKPEEANQFMRRYFLSPQSKGIYFPNENSSFVYLGPSRSNKNGKDFNIEDEGIAQFLPIRSNRQWRTVTLRPNSAEAQKILRARGRRYSTRNRGNKINEELLHLPRRRKVTQHRPSVSGNQELVTRRSNARKVLKEDPTKTTGQIESPIFLSNADKRSQNIRNSPDFFSREQYSLRVTSDPSRSNQQMVWPLNPAWNRPLSIDRSKRKSVEVNNRGENNKKIEGTPLIEESVIMLETQIPKPAIRPQKSKNFDNKMEGTSMRIAAAVIPISASMKHSFNDEDDWNRSSQEEEPSLNLFVVNGKSSSEVALLPMESENLNVDDSWDVAYPAYLDYSERLSDEEVEKGETPITKAVGTESMNLRRSRRISVENRKRKKRNVDILQAEQANKTIISSLNNKSTKTRISAEKRNRKKRNVDVLQAGQVNKTIFSSLNNRSNNTQNITRDKNSSGKRSRRSVQMIDWLRAAQEYHERLHQVRNAALRTWLASREELADTNLTNVKLFTREVPAYLEKYTPRFTAEDDSILKSEASHAYPIEIQDSRDPRISVPDDSESFAQFLHNQSSALENNSKPKIDAKNSQDSSSEMNSSMARKFTIIATGNSTIRIEELPGSNEDSKESLFEDQSAEGSINSELAISQQMEFATSDSEDFDHMYESIDAEDEDFDYGDPNFTLSRWLDEVDIIDASSVEIPEDKTKSITDDSLNDEEDYEVDELLSRSKRDSPLFLFKVKGNPREEVLVWPSNWKDFINRHFKRNRTRNFSASPQKMPKSSHTRISKFEAAKSPNLDKKVKTEQNAEISSTEETTNEYESEKDSSMELDLARRLFSFEHAFDNRARQNIKKNNVYRSNIGNYK